MRSKMDILLELLSDFWEYDLVEHNWNICKRDTDDEWEINIYTDYTSIIISKKYWFINFLYLNNLIDIAKVNKLWYITHTWDIDEVWEEYFILDRIYMLLALEENPINLLISFLK